MSIFSKRNTSIVVFCIVLLAVIAGVFILWDLFVIQKTITLTPAQNTVITVGTPIGDGLAPDNVIIKASEPTKKRLRPGNYKVEYSSEGHKSTYENLVLSKNIELKTPELEFTQEKLSALLAAEKSNIQKILMSAFTTPGYIIEDEKLYVRGEWYGARLVPADWYINNDAGMRSTNTNNRLDILRVIMEKRDGRWQIAANPSIIFFKDDYKNIPENVVRDVNSFGFN